MDGHWRRESRKSPLIPKLLVQMVAVGERTGRLQHLMVATANKMDDDEASARLKSMVALLEPLMIVVMGVISWEPSRYR